MVYVDTDWVLTVPPNPPSIELYTLRSSGARGVAVSEGDRGQSLHSSFESRFIGAECYVYRIELQSLDL